MKGLTMLWFVLLLCVGVAYGVAYAVSTVATALNGVAL